MIECPFYRTYWRTVVRNDLNSKAGADVSILIPWCGHRHSKTPIVATKGIAGGRLLGCRGDVTLCQLSQSEFDDV